MGTPRLLIRPGNPDFLDLPWEQPVSEWTHPRLVSMPTGVHRHPVVFVAYDEGVYAIKEEQTRLAGNEFEVLRLLEERTHRAAEPAGLVERAWLPPGSEQSAAVITRYVEHSFPYRHLISGAGFGARRAQLLDAIAGLLVDLHLAGCFWGDCSLSNVLYRYDAGGIEAVMIDAETSALHQPLSDGQRLHDIEIMKENLAGEMADIAAHDMVEIEQADLELGFDVEERYRALWAELTEELFITRDDGYKIRERLHRLHELGFSVEDFYLEPTDRGDLVRMKVHVGGRTFHGDRLRELTGIDAAENQARVILGDLSYYLAKTGSTSATGKNVGTIKWLTSVFDPLVERIRQVWHGQDPIQGYCDFLHHRMTMATAAGHDIDNERAFADWVAHGFPGFPLD